MKEAMPLGTSRGSAVLIHAACVVVILAGLRVAAEMVVPFVFAAFLAALTAPIVLWLRDRRVPLLLSIPFVVALVVVGFAAVGGVLVSSANSLLESWPRYETRVERLLESSFAWLRARGFPVHWGLVHRVVKPEDIVGVVGGMVTSVGRLLTDMTLVVLTMLFMLMEVSGLPKKIRLALGNPEADLSRFEKITKEVKDYIVIKTYLSLGVGLTVWGTLTLLEVDFALLWGVVAFVFNYVPNVGAIVAGAPPVVIAAVQHDFGVAAIVTIAFVAIHMLIGNLLEPHLLGRKLHLSALVVFFSLVFWGWIWGGAGMLLSVPLTMLIKISLENSTEWRWLAVLMDPPPEPEAAPFSWLPPQSRLTGSATGTPILGTRDTRAKSAQMTPLPSTLDSTSLRASTPPSRSG
jgi:predicted PurR-regulated permease PerM